VLAINNSSVVFDQNTNGAFTGVLSGNGSLTKNGTGTLYLNGNNTYSGPTTVNAGKLSVNGRIASNTTVAATGALGGIGTIAGNVTNSGTLVPGNSIGTLHIDGDFTSDPGSTVQIEVSAAGTVPGMDNDLIDVDGDVVLNGGVVDVVPTTGFLIDTPYTFLVYSGSLSGQFAGIVEDDIPLLDLQLIYGAGFVQLEYNR